MKSLVSIITAVVFLSCAGSRAVTPTGETPAVLSKLLSRVEAAASGTKKGIIDIWMKNLRQNDLPLRSGRDVTFVYRGAANFPVSVIGPFNGWKAGADVMVRVSGTDLYYLTLRLPDPEKKGTPYLYCKEPNRYNDFFRDPHNRNIVNHPRAEASYVHPGDGKRGYLQIAHRFLRSGNPKVNSRRITVYLPPSYYINRGKKYPVIYMQDGQNIWDSVSAPFGGWKVDSAADRLIKAGMIREMIIVGLPHSGIYRRPEYYPEGREFYDSAVKRVVAGYGEQFYRYIKDSVKTLVDTMYRTLPDRKNTVVAGSSSGGIISWYLAWKHPETFSRAALFSPWFIRHYNIAGGKKRSLTYDLLQAPKKDVVFYMDCGDAGWNLDGVKDTRAMLKAMKQKGWKEGKDLFFVLAPGAVHGEPAWRKRFPDFLKVFFGK